MKDFFVRLAILTLLFVIIPLILIYVFFESFDSEMIAVYDHENRKLFKIEFDKYLIGVVAAEMPADFNEEALKAQTVAARTYALKTKNSDVQEHNGADICTDYSHCQAYLSDDELRVKWGSDYVKNYAKIKQCVNETQKECLLYEGKYATSVFHSCSNGKTENASDVWGGTVDYLICVDSPGDLEKKDYVTEYRYSLEEFNTIISANEIKGCEPNPYCPVIGDMTMTDGNNVAAISIYGTNFTGVEVRKIFNLKSSAFEMSVDENNVIFKVYGNGHGVGMSQYGAQSMAKKGNTYRDILSHYYPGTEIGTMYK